MKMIPSSPYGTDSSAERKVFDCLREVLLGSRSDAPVAFHSLRLTQHERKRFCEVDFLICARQGLFVLEVKGGGVQSKDGRWWSNDRHGHRHDYNESPFRQAESALHALEARIRQELPDLAGRYRSGYGVLFPDCSFQVSGSEWEPPMVGDMRDVRDLDSWLERLVRFWFERNRRGEDLNPTDMGRLIRFFRPEFECAEPLFSHVSEVESRITSLTEDQMEALDIIDANPRVLSAGGAGTGKTFLAVELARRWTEAGAHVLVACHSPWLRNYLESRFIVPGLTVSTVSGLDQACRRAGVNCYDALIVDEGQDLFDMASLDRLDSVLQGGLASGRWCIFHDSNNQAGLIGIFDPDAEVFLRSLGPAIVPLRTNCRNTRVILDRVKRDLGADMGVRGAGEGPAIRECPATTFAASATLLATELDELVEVGGLDAGSITILSPFPFDQSSARLLPTTLRSKIAVLDEFSLRSFPPPRISFAQIAAFKGLENEAVILIDINTPCTTDEDRALLYVGMSRARAVLSMIRLETKSG